MAVDLKIKSNSKQVSKKFKRFLSTSRIDGRNSPEPVIAIINIGGDDRNRTGVQGFADLCVATPPRRHEER